MQRLRLLALAASAAALPLRAPPLRAPPAPLMIAPLTRRAVTAAAVAAFGAAPWLRPPPSQAAADYAAIDMDSFALRVPAFYYRPKGGRPRTGVYDDNVFLAADYPSGRTATVSITNAVKLLVDSGDPIAATSGPLTELRELGKPSKIASLLARRRDGDPQGVLPTPRHTVTSATREGNELRFELRELTYAASSVTSAAPTARVVQARTLFVPAAESRDGLATLVTAWASSPAAAAVCREVPCDCGERSALACACPPPVCTVDGAGPDPVDLAIVESLALAPPPRAA